MGAKLSHLMTALGFCSLAFYAVLTASGSLSTSLMPQFLVSSIIFLMSGRIMRRSVRLKEEDEEEKPKGPEADWPWLTGLLNWSAALMIIGIMAILLMKPIGVSIGDALSFSVAPEQFHATSIP